MKHELQTEQQDDLPPLPEAWITDWTTDDPASVRHYAADQMHDYARAAIAASQQAAERVAWRVAEFWSSANPGQKCLMLAKGEEELSTWGKRSDFIRWVSPPAIQQPQDERLALRYPSELTPELRGILGTMCFQIAREAALYRSAGHVIATKAEEEQAFMLDRFIRAYLQHGERWSIVIGDEITRMVETARAALAKKGGAA